MQAPASNYPVDTRSPSSASGWGGPSDAPTQITQGRTSLTVTLHLEDGSGRTFRLQRGANLLGRGQDAAFRLPDTGVSHQHAEIRFDGREALLSDLGSTNGTFVGDQRLTRTARLEPGEPFTVGRTVLELRA